jgi:peptidoglycan/xylan/chitin deacetylase (PgdA/CDA1 family)
MPFQSCCPDLEGLKLMGSVKQSLLNALLIPGFPACLRYVERDCATVFMLHRFQDKERGIAGCEVSHLRRALAYLKSNNYELVTLADLFERLGGKGPQAQGAVAFTIDDGYIDQATIAAPVFAEFDCPVTTFVSTGFLDGELWFWWDQIEHVFRHADCRSVQVALGDAVLAYRWDNDQQRDQAQAELTEKCKRVANQEKLAAIARLAQASGVKIPAKPPPHCAPMSWDQVRACEGMGMTFGPHTVTHPILSRTPHDDVDYELTRSWARLRAEARNPVPIFCYPNGGWDDFGDREVAALRRLGFLGALTAEPGYANARTFQDSEDDRFRVQRFGFPDEMPHLIQYVSGVERFKQLLRRKA